MTHTQFSSTDLPDTLYIQTIGRATQEVLKAYISKFCRIKHLSVGRIKASGISKVFAFMKLEDPKEGIRLCSQRHFLCGSLLTIQSLKKKVFGSGRSPLKKILLIFHLDKNTTEKDYANYF